jgi:nitroreductase
MMIRAALILVTMETYEAITTRRSVPKVRSESPGRDEVVKLLEAAVAAPNHHLTTPWRFIVLTGHALEELGAAWAEGDQRTGRDPAVALTKAMRAPVIITVIESPKAHLPKVVEVEEHHAVGAAMQNILLAAHDAGLAAMLRTGPAARLEEVRRYLGLAPEEFIAGFIYVGYPSDDGARPVPRRKPAGDVTEWRGWNEQ